MTMSRWIGKFPSVKLRRMVGYQSLIERDFIYLLDYDPAVSTYCEQPVTLHYLYDGKRRCYTPDFSFTADGRQFLVECKHHQYIQPEANRPKWDAARDWSSVHNTKFRVVTEQMIRVGCYLTNVKRLTDAARYAVTAKVQMEVQHYLEAHDGVRLIDLVERLDGVPTAGAVTVILHLVYRQLLWIPLSSPITPDSPVFLPQRRSTQLSLVSFVEGER
jgi:hypothetical protein